MFFLLVLYFPLVENFHRRALRESRATKWSRNASLDLDDGDTRINNAQARLLRVNARAA